MKRAIALLLAVMLTLSFCGCGKKKAEAGNNAQADPNAGKPSVWVVTEIHDVTGKYEFKVEYEEDHDLKRIEYRYEDADGKVYTTEKQYMFDSMGRLLTENVIRDKVNRVYTHSYDIYGNEVQSDCDYTYNDQGKILTVYNNANRQTASYTYNEDGDLIAKSDYYGDWTYTYDNNGRLLTEQADYGWCVNYTYDDSGKLTKMVSGYLNEDPEWTELYTYDANGNLSKISIQAPEFGEGKTVEYQLAYQQLYLTQEQIAVIQAQQDYIIGKISALTR